MKREKTLNPSNFSTAYRIQNADTEPRAQATGQEYNGFEQAEDYVEMCNGLGRRGAEARGGCLPLARRLRSGLCICVLNCVRTTGGASAPRGRAFLVFLANLYRAVGFNIL